MLIVPGPGIEPKKAAWVRSVKSEKRKVVRPALPMSLRNMRRSMSLTWPLVNTSGSIVCCSLACFSSSRLFFVDGEERVAKVLWVRARADG